MTVGIGDVEFDRDVDRRGAGPDPGGATVVGDPEGAAGTIEPGVAKVPTQSR